MQYLRFIGVWVLGSLILGVVHGWAVGAVLGLAIAVGYVAALRSMQASTTDHEVIGAKIGGLQ